MSVRVLCAALGAMALSGCLGQSVYVTSLGPLRVSEVPDLPVAQALATEEGLVARTLAGRPVPFEARDAALEAMEAHCLDEPEPSVPYFFGWRDVDGDPAWTAAGCVQVPATGDALAAE